MIAELHWHGPPPPAFQYIIDSTDPLPWIAAQNIYTGYTDTTPQYAEHYFHLDLESGAAHVDIIGYQAGHPVYWVHSAPFYVNVGQPIDKTITDWTGLPAGHTVTARYTT